MSEKALSAGTYIGSPQDDRDRYENEKVYTRRDVDQLIEQATRRLTVSRVLLTRGNSCVMDLAIEAILQTPEGLLIKVR